MALETFLAYFDPGYSTLTKHFGTTNYPVYKWCGTTNLNLIQRTPGKNAHGVITPA